MNKVKKQHIVPRFYLENFTNSRGKIFVFDIQTRKSFGLTPDNIAHRNGFYDFEPIDKILGDQIIEKSLADFEGISSHVITKLINLLIKGDLLDFNIEDRKIIAEYLFIQQNRTEENRVIYEHLVNETERQLLSKGATLESIQNLGLESYNFDSKSQQIRGLLDPENASIINDYSERNWVFWDNQTNHPFYTSDHPVIGYMHEDIGFSAYEIFFPITPRFGLSLFLKNEFKDWVSQDKKIEVVRDTKSVTFYNELIIRNCNRQVYNNDADFRLIELVLRRNPGLSDPNRQRIDEI